MSASELCGFLLVNTLDGKKNAKKARPLPKERVRRPEGRDNSLQDRCESLGTASTLKRGRGQLASLFCSRMWCLGWDRWVQVQHLGEGKHFCT